MRPALLLFVPALASAAFKYFNPTDTNAIPALLSQTGLYAVIGSKIPDTAAKAYEVNAPAWADWAILKRWILLPPGSRIPYDDSTDFFDYPDSTVFAQTILVESAPGDVTTGFYWETRLLIKKRDSGSDHHDWHGFSYRWDRTASDAALVSRSPTVGFDTVFAVGIPDSPLTTYMKWHFPSSAQCNACHRSGAAADSLGNLVFDRSILGFHPSQLKRRSATAAGNQVLDLFDSGVFSGIRPNAAQLARRFKGIGESISTSLTPDQRFAVLDTMARSYLAANCSGCHNHRVKIAGSTSADFDFFNLKPAMEFSAQTGNGFRLNDTGTFDTAYEPEGRAYYFNALAREGIDTGRGQIWDMAIPVGDPSLLTPQWVYPGYPSLSTLLFRQWARNPVWMDSYNTRRALLNAMNSSDSAERAAASVRLGWMFSEPWGSAAWLDTLANHGLTVDSVAGYEWDNGLGYQMPPSASTFVPDVPALKILGEWVKHYRNFDPDNPVLGIRAGPKTSSSEVPVLRGRTLLLPRAWKGQVMLFDTRGKRHLPIPSGHAAYRLPEGLVPGVYLFRIGSHSFKKSLF